MHITWHTQFSFGRSAADLENDRLRAQILDTADIMDMMLDGGDLKDPAWYMWRGSFEALLIMGMCYCMEWTFRRGYDDKVFWKFSRHADSMVKAREFNYAPPAWFRDADVCRSHRSVLMMAEPGSYDSELWPGTPERMPLLWPVVDKDDRAVYELRVAKADLPLVRAKKLRIPSATKVRVGNL